MSERQIINTHDQLMAVGGGVAITRAFSLGRETYQCGWRIYRVSAEGKRIATDPGAAWYDHKSKTFSYMGRAEKLVALETAKAWVAEHLGYSDVWVGNRMRDYVPAEINKRFPIQKGR